MANSSTQLKQNLANIDRLIVSALILQFESLSNVRVPDQTRWWFEDDKKLRLSISRGTAARINKATFIIGCNVHLFFAAVQR